MEKAVAVKVQFSSSDKKYTYLLPPVLIGQVAIGDYVIVPAGYGDMPYKVVKVVEYTSDFNKWRRNDIHYKYVVDKINTEDYLEREANKKKSDEFDAIMESIHAYCNKWNVEHFVTAEREFGVHCSPSSALTTTITITDYNKYTPFYEWEPQR